MSLVLRTWQKIDSDTHFPYPPLQASLQTMPLQATPFPLCKPSALPCRPRPDPIIADLIPNIFLIHFLISVFHFPTPFKSFNEHSLS